MRRRLTWAAAAAFIFLLPLSLAGVDVVFYQCVDNDGVVLFTNKEPRGEQRCIRLGAREERAELDNKVRRYFASGDESMPALTANVIQNSQAGLRRFHEKLDAFGAGQDKAVAIYFVGDSHLQSGDLVKGFLDELELDHQVDRTLLCVHKVRKVRVRRGRGKRYVARLPKDYPKGVPRICSPLMEIAPPLLQTQGSDQSFDTAPAITYGGQAEALLRPGGPVNVYAYGVSGKTFDYFANSELMEKDLASYRPDLIVVMLGTNDAFARPDEETVKRGIAAFAGLLRRAAPDSDVLFIGPPDSFFKNGNDNEYINLVRKELQAISTEQGFAYWDLYTVMGGPRSMVKWREKGLSQKDKIHFLADGYMILGRLFYQALAQ
jgi:lysophospholipase L1-like esterase